MSSHRSSSYERAHDVVVSVVIPVYNGARHLGAAIESVLDQSCPPQEVIVVNDGSCDGSREIGACYAPQVRTIDQPHSGAAAARNRGVDHARGVLLAFLDADDLWEPDKLARQVAVLAENLACEAVLGGMENFISPELDAAARRLLARAAVQTGTIHVGALLIRRLAFDRVGPFDVQWRLGEFIQWWARAEREQASLRNNSRARVAAALACPQHDPRPGC